MYERAVMIDNCKHLTTALLERLPCSGLRASLKLGYEVHAAIATFLLMKIASGLQDISRKETHLFCPELVRGHCSGWAREYIG